MTHTQMFPRMLALGLDPVYCDPARTIESLEKLPEHERKLGLSMAVTHKRSRLRDSWHISLDYLLRGDPVQARNWAEKSLVAAEDYFFGEWRNLAPVAKGKPPDREFWDRTEFWAEEFDVTMLFAAVLDRWQDFQHFATYLRDDVEAVCDQTEAHRAWWLYFCGLIRERPATEIDAFRQTVLSERPKVDKFLLRWVDGIVSGDDRELQAAVDEYFQYHRRFEVKEYGIERRLAVRGNVLLRWGAHCGRKVIVPEYAQLYIVEF